MSTYIDSERLIVEVEKRPRLYNKKVPEYSDKNIKEKLWKEACEVIIPNWSQLEGQQKVQQGKSILLLVNFYYPCLNRYLVNI